jgi:Ca-activated chloride channel family protein
MWSRSVEFKSAWYVIVVLNAIALCLAPALAGQGERPIKLRTDLVTVDAAVTDKNGNFIRNLKSDDFVVFEDGAPQKVEFFEASEQASLTRPLALVIALDISGSIKPEEIAKHKL